jgi:hypothetical protein
VIWIFAAVVLILFTLNPAFRKWTLWLSGISIATIAFCLLLSANHDRESRVPNSDLSPTQIQTNQN